MHNVIITKATHTLRHEKQHLLKNNVKKSQEQKNNKLLKFSPAHFSD